MSTNPLLDALLRNESGGRNIANTHEGTTSGQAQGHFQITTGTWRDFGGTKYAPNPLGATYEQQAEIASKIPLKRWDTSTINAMRGTGLPVNPNLTLGQNLGGNFNSGKYGLTMSGGVPATADPNPIVPLQRGMPQAPTLPPPVNIMDHPIMGVQDPAAPTAVAATDPAAPATTGSNIMDMITKLTTPGGKDGDKASPLGALASAFSPPAQQRQPDQIINTGNLQSSDMMQQTQNSNAQQLMQTLIAKRKQRQMPQVPGLNITGMMG